MPKVQIWGYRCERCEHEWVPRAGNEEDPKVCPKCKSPYWDTPRSTPMKKKIPPEVLKRLTKKSGS